MKHTLLNEAVDKGAEYAEFFTYELDAIERTVRKHSAEFNQSSSKTYALRVLHEGAWGTASSQKFSTRLVEEALGRAAKARAYSKLRFKLAKRKPAKGLFNFTCSDDVDSVEDLSESLIKILKKFEVEHLDFYEAVSTTSRVGRAMYSSDGVEAYEVRDFIDVSLSIMDDNFITSTCLGWSGGLPTDCMDRLEGAVVNLIERLKAKKRAKLLNPFFKGSRFKTVLIGEAACAFIHEAIGHALEADVLIWCKQIFKAFKDRHGCEELSVYDDPSLSLGYGSYMFDDEGVEAEPKRLVNCGRVVGLLHTRWTAEETGVEPMGNGRGIFHAPKAMMSNLRVSRGSWSLEEMVQDMDEGFLIEGLVKAEVYGGRIRIYPEIARYVKKGEITEPTLIEEASVPLNRALSLIDAVGKSDFTLRSSVEKGLPISELSPPLKLSSTYLR